MKSSVVKTVVALSLLVLTACGASNGSQFNATNFDGTYAYKSSTCSSSTQPITVINNVIPVADVSTVSGCADVASITVYDTGNPKSYKVTCDTSPTCQAARTASGTTCQNVDTYTIPDAYRFFQASGSGNSLEVKNDTCSTSYGK